MRRVLSALSLLPVLALAPACDGGDEEVGDAFRNGSMELDVDISLTQPDEDDDPGNNTIIWDLVEAGVFDGPAANGNLLMTIEGNDIYNSEGVHTCTVNQAYLDSNVREVISVNGGETLFTVAGTNVYDGWVDVNNLTYGQLYRKHKDQLLLTFDQEKVYYGEYDLLALVGTADIETASDGRKLLIAALMEGHCGSAGLPY